MYDVVIIGAGVTGLSVARQLSRFQLRAAVIEAEPDVGMGATKANSAIIHGGYAESAASLKGQLCYRGRSQFARLDQELHFGFRPTGSLVISRDPADLPQLRALLANGQKNGLNDLSLLDQEQIRRLEPAIRPEVCYALYCRGAGICSPYGLAIALAENALRNGVEIFLNQPVQEISKIQAGRQPAWLIRTPAQQLSSRYIVNCSGLSATKIQLLAGLQPDFGIRARSGEYLLFQRGSGRKVRQVIFQMPTRLGKGVLVAPTIHDNLIIGPDALDEDGDGDRSTHIERLAAIYNQSKQTTEAIDPRQMIRSFSGVRAVATTDDFIIEKAVAGWIEAAGIQSPGLTASPAVAEQVVDLLADAGLNLRPDPAFCAQNPPLEEQDKTWLPMSEVVERANLSPGPQRMICRCEQVQEQQIMAACRRGLPVLTADAVKRRTRAGMGICQGSFCRSRVVSLLRQYSPGYYDSQTDVQRLGLHRVERTEWLNWLKTSAVDSSS